MAILSLMGRSGSVGRVFDSVADPEGVKGIHLSAFLRPNYFIFVGIFKKK